MKPLVKYLLLSSSLLINPMLAQDSNINQNSLEYKLNQESSVDKKRSLILKEMKGKSIEGDAFRDLANKLSFVYLDAALDREFNLKFKEANILYSKAKRIPINYKKKSNRDLDEDLVSKIKTMSENCNAKISELNDNKNNAEYMGKQNLMMGNYDLAKKQLKNTKYERLPDFLKTYDLMHKNYQKDLKSKEKTFNLLTKLFLKKEWGNSDSNKAKNYINKLYDGGEGKEILLNIYDLKINKKDLPQYFENIMLNHRMQFLSNHCFKSPKFTLQDFSKQTENYFEIVNNEKNIFLRNRAYDFYFKNCSKLIRQNNLTSDFRKIRYFYNLKDDLFNANDITYIDLFKKDLKKFSTIKKKSLLGSNK
ncbi:hypothetical protein KY321_00385 [Candidatus Woesearchaeota archaeon]|nr:hypothetical protein [Candidatus Woesearchaeota archaeon]